jgi:hypothetical protein
VGFACVDAVSNHQFNFKFTPPVYSGSELGFFLSTKKTRLMAGSNNVKTYQQTLFLSRGVLYRISQNL